MTGVEIALAAAAVAASVASAGMGMAQSRQQANFQAQVAARNSLIEQQNAQRAVQRSQVEQQEQDLTARAIMGEQLAEQSASGLSINNSKSFTLARKGLSETARLDALNIRQAGEVDKYNHLIGKMEADTERSGALAAKRNATISGAMDIGSSLIGGASTLAGAGAFGGGGTFKPVAGTGGPRRGGRRGSSSSSLFS